MTVAEAKPIAKASPVEEKPSSPAQAPKIQGRVDAYENGRLLGWAWDAANPGDRMTIHVFHDGTRVLSKVADTPRIDLRRNGIGDGAYSFDLELPQAVNSAPEGMTVMAETPRDGTKIPLPRPSAEERAAEAAVALPLSMVMGKLDRLIEVQRQSAVGQRDATTLLRQTTQRIDELSSNEGELGEALSILKSGQGDLNQRVQELEVFLLRFDSTLKGFDDRLKALGEKNRNNLKWHFLLLTALLGIIAGMLFAAISGLWG